MGLGCARELLPSMSASFSYFSWGSPSDPRTFSGSARGLFDALTRAQVLRNQYDAKSLRPWDIFRGAFAFDMSTLRPTVAPNWIYHQPGAEVLSRRLNQQIRRRNDFGNFLQMGTAIRLDPDLGSHFITTDATIRQIVAARAFKVSDLDGGGTEKAIAWQQQRFEEAKQIFAFSQWCADSIIDDYGISKSKVSVCYAGPNAALELVDRRIHSAREILFVGIDWERKNGPLLVEAFHLVKKVFPDVTLSIVGCSPQLSDDRINVFGYLDRRLPAQAKLLADLFARATCFCLPSVFDPFPIAVLEAASAELPSVVIDSGSRREAVVDGKTGIVVPEPTIESLAEGLIRAIRDPENNRAMGRAARERAAMKFTWDNVVKRITDSIATGCD